MAQGSKVGLVGVGTMGKGLGRNILKKGFELAVADTDPKAVERMVAMGAMPANGVAGLAASCDIVGACMPSLEAIQAVFDGPNGLIANARKGTVLIDFSTSDPKLTQTLGAKAQAAGVAVVDAPMLRMEQAAWNGTLVLLVGGAVADVERCRGVFEAVSERWIHCGDLGAGHTFKLLNNMTGLAVHAAYCESFTLARKMGLELDRLYDVLSSGMSGSTILKAMGQRVINDDHSPLFATDIALKDITLFTRLAQAQNSPAFAADGARQVYQLASMMGYGNENITRLATALARLAGTKFGD
jgi:3-hydroxyisobutyrate dehydrogenase-like beta-hydroxyacid dehydrogenase